jgi:diaminohydroxyphosphoribosylaminopyrimidine deaminase/5-amino-6-(5-phosphoribosylamino)uracil reductase
MAGDKARGACAYISLEPCSHYGKTPPCTDALVKSGISRVVTALSDPDERVSGRGHEKLRQAGVEVIEHVESNVSSYALRGHLLRHKQGRPWVTLKLAISDDDFIALNSETRTCLTGEEAQRFTHGLRSVNEAILVGSGTVLADNPSLTTRLPGRETDCPQRVVLDRSGRFPIGAKMLKDGRGKVWIVTSGSTVDAMRLRLGSLADILEPDLGHKSRYDDAAMLMATVNVLAERGISRLMIEGGSKIARAALTADLIDEAYILKSPKKIGPNGVKPFGLTPMQVFYDRMKPTDQNGQKLGQDTVLHYLRR